MRYIQQQVSPTSQRGLSVEWEECGEMTRFSSKREALAAMRSLKKDLGWHGIRIWDDEDQTEVARVDIKWDENGNPVTDQ